MKRFKDLSPALQLCVRTLRRKPDTRFAVLRQRALNKGITLWPIQFGRAVHWLRHRGELAT